MYTITLSTETVYRLFKACDGYDWWEDEEFLFIWENVNMEFADFHLWFADRFDASTHRKRTTTPVLSYHRYEFIARFKTEKEATMFLLEWA
jgi:hypothetical protein